MKIFAHIKGDKGEMSSESGSVTPRDVNRCSENAKKTQMMTDLTLKVEADQHREQPTEYLFQTRSVKIRIGAKDCSLP